MVNPFLLLGQYYTITKDINDEFRNKILEQFMPPELRAQTSLGLDTRTLTEPGKFVGSFSFCLKTTAITASRTFYEAMGLEIPGNNDERWVHLGNGDCQLDLMTFPDENWLNFRAPILSKSMRRCLLPG